MNKKIKIICKKHGDFKQTPGSHLNGSGCPKCGTESQIEKRKLGLREFIKRSKIRHREKYDYSNVNYKNQTKEVEIVCNIHGVFFQKPQYHISGSGCPKCSIIEQHEKQKKTLDEFIEDSMKVHGKKYDYSRSKYITSKDKITIICKKHGEFYSTPNNHLRGTGCPNCNISKGEEEIRLFLKSQKINFSTQHTFESLKMKRKLKCDFFLREFNLVIEYNGIQHYEPREFSGGINGLLRIQESDKLKEDYCKKNGIGFEVIRFDEDISERINEILKKYFKKRKEDIFK